MLNSKYGNVLTIILVIVIVLILGLVGWFTFDMISNNSKNQKAQDAINQFENTTVNKKKVSSESNTDDEDIGFEQIDDIENNKTSGTSKVYLAGYEVKGTIEIPKTGIKYPILANVTKKSLESAVAILWGPGLNEVGNTVILGHNYRNGLYFSDNDKLANGDIIYITDQNKNKVKYEIYKIELLEPDESEYMTRDTENRREISLSTCTDDAKERLVIWAKEKESK